MSLKSNLYILSAAAALLSSSAAAWSVHAPHDASTLSPQPADPDVGKDMVEIIQTRGYPVESHFATTPDGYILNMFRIPHGKSASASASTGSDGAKPVVLLQHGLLDSSFTWVNNYDNESLAYILADAGFDVWMGNNRGNRYGRNHTTLDPDAQDPALAKQFWDFSWDEMASTDVPTMINYALDTSSAPSLGWVGHSEGTIQMFAAAATVGVQESDTSEAAKFLREAVQRVNVFAALAPVAYVNNCESKPIQLLAPKLIVDDIYARGIYEIGKFDDQLNALAPKICQAADTACELFLDAICGPSHNMNDTRVQVYVSGTPAGTSTMNMLHWEQGILNANFQKHDFGSPEANTEHYGSPTPPQYNLSAIPGSFRIALFSGGLDYLADPTDVECLAAELPPGTVVMHEKTPDFAHLDYTWAYNAADKVYGHVLDVLTQFK